MLLLETHHHATEILTNEVFKERVGGVASIDIVLLEEFIGEVGASFEGQTLREAKGVVAVEKNVLDLEDKIVSVSISLVPVVV